MTRRPRSWSQAQEGASTLLREAQSQANEIQERSEGSSAERVAEAELMVANARQEALGGRGGGSGSTLWPRVMR